MRRLLFFLAEALIISALCLVVFGAVIYQPVVVWVVAPAIMLCGFIGIARWAKLAKQRAWITVFVSPLSYTLWLLAMGFGLNAGPIGALPFAMAYYFPGVALLTGHFFANAKLR